MSPVRISDTSAAALGAQDKSVANMMPRGGPHASWLDRLLQTSALEYTDRNDIPDSRKHKVVRALDVLGERTNQHVELAQLVAGVLAGVDNARVLELGAGHGRLSEKIIAAHPTATVTVSDVDPASVARIAASVVANNPRLSVKTVDATAIDEPDASYDLVVFVQAFHHLPPEMARLAITEATRVGRRFLVVDLKRKKPFALLTHPLVMPVFALLWLPWSTIPAAIHDAVISWLRAYSQSALTALGTAADPSMQVEFLTLTGQAAKVMQAVVFSRPVARPCRGRSDEGGEQVV
jgi:SAM-dependent methyltransferase